MGPSSRVCSSFDRIWVRPQGQGDVQTRSATVYASLAPLGRVAEWQTRTVQVRVSVRTWGFNSPLAHEISEILACGEHRPLISSSCWGAEPPKPPTVRDGSDPAWSRCGSGLLLFSLFLQFTLWS